MKMSLIALSRHAERHRRIKDLMTFVTENLVNRAFQALKYKISRRKQLINIEKKSEII